MFGEGRVVRDPAQGHDADDAAVASGDQARALTGRMIRDLLLGSERVTGDVPGDEGDDFVRVDVWQILSNHRLN